MSEIECREERDANWFWRAQVHEWRRQAGSWRAAPIMKYRSRARAA